MRKAMLSVCVLLIGGLRAWAGDAPPTLESNQAAIELVQVHANSR